MESCLIACTHVSVSNLVLYYVLSMFMYIGLVQHVMFHAGGHFVCKVFDMFTPFSVGLFYLLYRCFERVCIFKPVTSRPANSERYSAYVEHVVTYVCVCVCV